MHFFHYKNTQQTKNRKELLQPAKIWAFPVVINDGVGSLG